MSVCTSGLGWPRGGKGVWAEVTKEPIRVQSEPNRSVQNKVNQTQSRKTN